MKVLIVLSAFVIAAAVADDAAREKAMKAMKKCQEEAGVTDDDFQKIREKDELESPAAKKMMACIFTGNKIIQNNKFSPEGSMDVAREVLGKMPDSEAKLKIAQQTADTCASEIGDVETTVDEMAKLIFDCLKKQAKMNGLGPITT